VGFIQLSSVLIAADHKFKLPEIPDSKALDEFPVKQKAADPLRFPDLSLAVIKLLGAGEYIAETPEGDTQGHFCLAVKDDTHSTTPNRRYPDLLTQRLCSSRRPRRHFQGKSCTGDSARSNMQKSVHQNIEADKLTTDDVKVANWRIYYERFCTKHRKHRRQE